MLEFTITFLIAIATILAVNQYFRYQKIPASVPGPIRWPYIGQALTFLSFTRKRKLPDYFEMLYKKHGPICVFSLPPFDQLLISDPETIRRVLRSPDFVRPNVLQELCSGFVDNALFTLPSGDSWARHRKQLSPAFGPSHLRSAYVVANELIDKLANHFYKKLQDSDSIIVDINACFECLSIDMIGRIAYSFDFKEIDSLNTMKSSAESETIKRILHFGMERFGVNKRYWRLLGIAEDSPRLYKETSFMQRKMANLIEARRSKNIHKTADEKTGFQLDFMDRLLADDGETGTLKFTDDEIIGELLGIFLAGFETTTAALTFVILELCKNIVVMDKVVSEIDRVYRELNGDINSENIHNFKYLDMAVKEAMRLHPSVFNIVKATKNPVNILGYNIGAGTKIALNIRGVHRCEKYWKDALVFNPDRFESAEDILPGSYVPFSDGPQSCIGMKLAKVEMKCFLIHLLRRFDLKLVPGQNLQDCGFFTLGLENGLKVQLSSRK